MSDLAPTAIPAAARAICADPSVPEHDLRLRVISWGAAPASDTLLRAMADRFPHALNVAVFGRADERWGEVPIAAVAPRQGEEVTLAELQEWLDDRLARFKRPKGLVTAPALPRNAGGKVDTIALRASDRELSV